MSSSPGSGASTPSPPTLEELTTRSAAALLLPWVVGLTSDHPTAASSASAASPNREVVVFVHQPTRSVALMEGSSDIDSFLSELIASKQGPPPASKSSIDTLPRVSLSRDEGFECPICLEDHDEGGRGGDDVEVKEMPCKHKFHADCIDKWLGMTGTCPVCRFGMPVEEKKVDEMTGWRIHVFFARGRGSSESGRDSSSGSGEEEERDDDEEVGHGSDSDDDDASPASSHEMETDDS